MPNRALLAEALSTKAERKVEIRVPQRGNEVGIVEHALAQRPRSVGAQARRKFIAARLLEGIAERFDLAAAPRRIEVFDNSHIRGTNAVGAMIVAGAEGFVKGQYRKFNIKSPDLAPGDDYAMMREVLTRRFKRIADAEVLDDIENEVAELEAETAGLEPAPAVAAATEDQSADDRVFPDRPDLVLIDGGLGQLSVAREVLARFGLTTSL